jgi:putative DNA primase/helicase
VNLPPRVSLKVDTIPQELKLLRRWVVWHYRERKGKWTKPPCRPSDGKAASVNKPDDWGTFEEALAALADGGDKYFGVGLMLTEEDGVVAWDLDHCLNPKTLELSPTAREIVDTLKSYTEVTPSGQGMRVLVYAELPAGARRKGPIEVYCADRYVTITGNAWPGGSASVEPRERANAAMYQKYVAAEDPAFSRAMKDHRIRKLYDGDWEGNFPSQSEADLDLCRRLLAFGDEAQVDRWFRASQLYRDKWDERHGDKTYGAKTLEVAVQLFKKGGNGERESLTDVGNARRFAKLLADRGRWCDDFQRWFIWNGTLLEEDHVGRAQHMAEEIVYQLLDEASRATDSDDRKALAKHAISLQSRGRLQSMVELAKIQPGVGISPAQLDHDPNLINCQNGTLDFSSGEVQFREHRLEDYATRATAASYDEAAVCPKWEKFVNEIAGGRSELVEYLRRVVGYSLTGLTTEQKIFFLYGTGANGKTTFVETIRQVMGPYADTLDTSVIVTKREEQHPTGLADLKGLHLAIVPELPAKRLNEELVKQITGGDALKARRMRQDFFVFKSHAKLWAYGNYKPTIQGMDSGLWRRLALVPFTVTIPEEAQVKDLKEQLLEERDGILQWALVGYQDWAVGGLREPEVITTVTGDYRIEQDVLAAFLEEETQATVVNVPDSYTDAIYRRWVEWCDNRGEHAGNQRSLTARLAERGFELKTGAHNRKRFLTLSLVPRQEPRGGM